MNAYRRINVDGTRNLAKQAVAIGIKRFIFLSFIKVNGEGTIAPKSFVGQNIYNKLSLAIGFQDKQDMIKKSI